MVVPGVTAAVVLVVVLAVLVSFNRFVQQRQLIANAWSTVDTELKRRYDLVPNLVETVRGYAAHESATLQEVVRARSGAIGSTGPPVEQAPPENVLVDALRHLLALQERYPELEADRGFLDLQEELVRTEDRIQAARRFYNANVRDYNTRVQSLPSNLVARLGGFRTEGYFELAALERAAPAVSFEPDDPAPAP